MRKQFREHPGDHGLHREARVRPGGRDVTRDSLRELATPGLLAVLAPIAVGFAFGYAPLGAFLAGAVRGRRADGRLPVQAPAGPGTTPRSWSRTGTTAARARPAHEATIIGDTVGDPFKDTAGPAINPLIKVMNLVSLLIATSVVKYSHNLGLRAGVAIAAIAIIVGAVVVSKRRAPAPGRLGRADGLDGRGQSYHGGRRRGHQSPPTSRLREHRGR